MTVSYDRLQSIERAAKTMHLSHARVKEEAIKHGLAIQIGARIKVDPEALKSALKDQVYYEPKRKQRVNRPRPQRQIHPDVTC